MMQPDWQRIAGTGLVAVLVGLTGMTETLRAQTLEEIVVTARRVEERLQDVPLAVTVHDAATIEAAGISSLGDVAALTPGLSFFNPFGEQLPLPVIRGVAPTDIFGQPNAAVFVDGIYVAARRGINFSQLDFERIEVLKGPQSAMYGRTAFAGAINYVSRTPSTEFESTITGEIGNRGKQRGVLSVGGPIFGEQFRGRASLSYDGWDGSYDNLLPDGNDIGGFTHRTFQGALLWEPVPVLSMQGRVYHSNDRIDDSTTGTLPANCEPRLPAPDNTAPDALRLQNVCGQIPRLRDLPADNGRRSMAKIPQATGMAREVTRLTLNIDLDSPFGVLSSLTGYTRTKQESFNDFAHDLGHGVSFVYCPDAAAGAARTPNSCLTDERLRFSSGTLNVELGDTIREFSQELRITSPRDARFRYLLGGIYYREDQNSLPGGIIGTRPPPEGDIGLGPFDFPLTDFAVGTAIFWDTFFRDDGGIDPLRRASFSQDAEGYGIFGAIDYDLTDRLTVRGELRHSHDRREQTSFLFRRCVEGQEALCGDEKWDLREVAAVPNDPANPGQGTEFGSQRFRSITWRVGVDFRLTDEWMVYASVATGDKPGGIQVSVPNAIQDDGTLERERIVSSFDTEELTAYEIGLKGGTPDGRIGVDLAVYYYDWSEIVLRQLSENSPVTGRPLEQPLSTNVNAADATVWGWELATNAAVTDDLTAIVTVGYTDAKLDDAAQDSFETFPSFFPDGDVSGNRLLRQPEWMSSVTLDYRRQVPRGLELRARTDVSYQDRLFIGNDNQSWLPSRTTVNARLGLHGDRASLEFWVRNLFDDGKPTGAFRDIYWSNTANQHPPFQQPPTSTFADFPPFRYTIDYPSLRTFGITGRVRFGGAVR